MSITKNILSLCFIARRHIRCTANYLSGSSGREGCAINMKFTLMKHTILTLTTALLLSPLAALHATDTAQATKPNIIVILADDMGFEALGCYGGKTYKQNSKVLGAVKTPNLDAIAKNGMLFKTCFATPVCSPARAELLTGKYNFRVGLHDICGRKGAVESLDSQAHPTVAMLLKSAGYVTASVGKWHLGAPNHSPKVKGEVPVSAEVDTDYPHVRASGFDRQCMFSGGHLVDYYDESGNYVPNTLHRWALRFLESRKGKPEPFFLYYASPIPHLPFIHTPLNSTEGRDGPNCYPDLIEYLDRQVGEVVKKLSELGMSENTLLLFTADNGGAQGITTVMEDGREIRGGKATLLDTGSWVPLLASWPGKIKSGSIYDGLVDFTDIMPTCLEIAKVAVPNGIDGISFASQLQGHPGQPRECVHSLYLKEYFVRDSKWKLRENGNLYDVSNSPFSESLVVPEKVTVEAKSARQRLQGILDRLHPDHSASEKP